MENHDYLPYIDETGQSRDAELATAQSLITAALDGASSDILHPSVPAVYEPTLSPLIAASYDLLASSGSARAPSTGVDLTRYEEPTAPVLNADVPASERRVQWRAALSQASTSHAYLSSRQLNLSLLERYGKNAWLIGNSQVEEELKVLEAELSETLRLIEATDEERRQRQMAVSGEIEGLEQAWRSGVGRAIEAEVAGQVLRRQILEKSRR